MALEDRGRLPWAPVRLSEENIALDASCLETAETRHGDFSLTTTRRDSLTRIERDGSMIGPVGQGRDRSVRQVMERAGQVVTVYKKGSLVAACKGSYRIGKLRAIQNKGACLPAL
jgi:hypothetical protein